MVELRALTHVPVGAIVFFLGAFEKCGKVTMSFVMSVHPSVGMVQLASNWTDFYKNWYLRIFF
jgi:hypothetical protein